MKKNLILLFAPLMLLLIMLAAGYSLIGSSETNRTTENLNAIQTSQIHNNVSQKNQTNLKTPASDNWVYKGTSYTKPSNLNARTLSLVNYAMDLIGSPYMYGGITSDGFDCSGFIKHVYDTHGITISRSSATQAHDGISIERTEAAPGDLVIFTGTNPSMREPGHVGIVISEPGATTTFIHSSSNGGVKVSKIEGTNYDRRFLEIRRVM